MYNRTPSKARAVADRFQGVAIEALTPQALKDATGGRELVAIVSTIPAAAGFTVRRLFLEREGRRRVSARRPCVVIGGSRFALA